MKILLTTLNSKYIHSNLALKYLYAVCEDYHEDLYLKEFTINNDNDYIYGELIRDGYDIICFSCYIWNIERTLSLVDDLKKAKPNLIIILGGPEVSYQVYDLIVNNKGIDYILTGEGEENFPLLLEAISQNNMEKIKTIEGLIYRHDGGIYTNAEASPVDFESVPFPYKSLVSEVDKIIYYESSRGCPFSCSYCLSAADRGVRVLPLDRVKQDLSY
ncbi:MAG: B12-binding domain-containing radical SAM protein, partial [Clostridiales bacterium]|nr:B12-binding domain-containing radical SAM protein [Clostridiales bacterium]